MTGDILAVARVFFAVYVMVLAVPPLREFFEQSLLRVNNYRFLFDRIIVVFGIAIYLAKLNSSIDCFLGVDIS